MDASPADDAFFRDWSDSQLKEYIGDSGGHENNPFTTRQQLVEQATRITRDAQQAPDSKASTTAPSTTAPSAPPVLGIAVGRLGPGPQPSCQPPPHRPNAQQPAPAPFQPTGRKRALLCGCNYMRSPYALRGCINDVHCMRHLLITRFGFTDADIQVLTDDQPHPAGWPTRANMIYQMQRLVQACQPGDSLVFQFSGHGSQVRDYSGDELDGLNETLLPCDFRAAGQLTDDEVNRILVNPLPHGVRLHAIIDACHSGSAMDLEFRCKVKYDGPRWKQEYLWRPRHYKGTSGGQAIQFGASRDSETAADTSRLSGGIYSTGAATFLFIQAIEQMGTGISYGNLLASMTRNLEQLRPMPSLGLGTSFGTLGRWLDGAQTSFGAAMGMKSQTPVMSANWPFDLNMPIGI